MSVSAEHQSKVAEWRQKAREGTLLREEMKEAIAFLRAERVAMPQGKPKTTKPVIDANDLLSELDGI